MNFSDLQSYFRRSSEHSPELYAHPVRARFFAYGWWRVRAFRTIEPTARSFFDCYGHAYRDAVRRFLAAVNAFRPEGAEPVTREAFDAWLSEPETEARKVRRLAREEKARALRASRRVSRAA